MIVLNRHWIPRYKRKLLTSVYMFLMFGPVIASAEGQHEFLLFPSIDTFTPFSESDPEAIDSFERATLNALYSYSSGNVRLLGEYLWSTQEAELERLKAGFPLKDNGLVWIGRFHATAKYWTSEYHHGQFLQTSITRPSVEEWEDESGPMPSHVTGMSLEFDHQTSGDPVLSFALSGGLTARFEGEELVAFDLLDPRSDHGPGFNFKIAYRPELLSSMQLGLLSAWHEIRVDSGSSPNLEDLDYIDQLTVGVFADWRWKGLRLITSIIYFDNTLEYQDISEDDRFGLGYLQFEYGISEDFTFFGRTDNGIDEDFSPYLRLLPAFIAHRHMLGLRWDVARHHSLTAEIADTAQKGEDFDNDYFKEIRFQWSAVFP